jgi:hypothetical protein
LLKQEIDEVLNASKKDGEDDQNSEIYKQALIDLQALNEYLQEQV